jgi:hypothetical protein
MNMNARRWTRLDKTLAAAGVAIGGVVLVGAALNASANGDTDKLSALEVACEAMADGDTPDQAYELIVNLSEDKPYTVENAELMARTAVDRALAGDCD